MRRTGTSLLLAGAPEATRGPGCLLERVQRCQGPGGPEARALGPARWAETPVPPPAAPIGEGLAGGSLALGGGLAGAEPGGNPGSRRVSRSLRGAGAEVPTGPAAFGRLRAVRRVPGLAVGCRLQEPWRSSYVSGGGVWEAHACILRILAFLVSFAGSHFIQAGFTEASERNSERNNSFFQLFFFFKLSKYKFRLRSRRYRCPSYAFLLPPVLH